MRVGRDDPPYRRLSSVRRQGWSFDPRSSLTRPCV